MKKFLIPILVLLMCSTVYALPPEPIFHWAGARDYNKYNATSDTTLTEDNITDNKFISNQGASGEVDVTLPVISYTITVVFMTEETQIIEVNPPSGEAFDLDGTTLDANDVVDMENVVGSKLVATRMQNASGTWIWSLDTVRGNHVDSGASD